MSARLSNLVSSQWARVRELYQSGELYQSAGAALGLAAPVPTTLPEASATAPPVKNETRSKNDTWRALLAHAEGPDGGGAERVRELRAAIAEANESAAAAAGGASSPSSRRAGEPVAAIPSSDGFLRACLRAKKYDVKKAFQVARHYEEFRQRALWLPGGVTAASLAPELRSGFNLLLPHPDADGNVVLSQSMRELSALQHAGGIERMQRAGYYLLHRALQRPGAQQRGIAVLLDFEGFTWRHLRSLSTADLRRGISMLQDCFPARLAVIYVVHEPRWLSLLVQLLRPFLSRDSMENKFLLCGNGEKLSEYLPAAQLPAALGLGGTLRFDWEAQLSRWLADEAPRPANWDVASLFGEAEPAPTGRRI